MLRASMVSSSLKSDTSIGQNADGVIEHFYQLCLIKYSVVEIAERFNNVLGNAFRYIAYPFEVIVNLLAQPAGSEGQ